MTRNHTETHRAVTESHRALCGSPCLLRETLCNVRAIQKEPFDYTQWQDNLFEGMTVREISDLAADYREMHTP